MKTERPPTALTLDPPHWGARGLSYVLILLFVAATVAAIAIEVPETVSCPFVLVPVGGTDPVRAPHDGFIDVRVTDSQTVAAGETLFVIRSDLAGDRSGELATLTVQRDGAEESRTNAKKKYETQKLADEAEIRRLEARAEALARKLEGMKKVHTLQEEVYQQSRTSLQKEIDSLKNEVEFRRKIRDAALDVADRADKLSRSRAISDVESLLIQQQVDHSKLELEKSDRAQVAARLKLTQLQTEHASQEESWLLTVDQVETERLETTATLARSRHQSQVAAQEHAELDRSLQETIKKTGIRIAALKEELDRSRGNAVAVPAPRAGTVLLLQVKGSGAFVRTGDILCELAPSGKALQAELTVPQTGVGRILPEHRVKLLYDSFPYERFGAKHGTVRWVSPAGIPQNGGQVFRVLADTDDLMVRADGQNRPLRAGMAGRAEVVVGRRSLISYAVEPLRQLRENLAEPPAKTP